LLESRIRSLSSRIGSGRESVTFGDRVMAAFLARVTFYTLVGITSSGQRTGIGTAACSDWIPLYTRLEFPDKFSVTCLDRGYGGHYWKAWIDVWAPSYSWGVTNVRNTYGDYSWVTLVDSSITDGVGSE
jgi:hypothetical protein